MADLIASIGLVRQAIHRKTSAGGMGFAGATGLVASGLTDLASLLGPILFWFFVLASIVAVILAVTIHVGERAAVETGQEPPRLGLYCHSLLALLGALFGSGILLITGLFQGNTDGSQLLALLRDTTESVGRIETKVGEIDTQVEGIGQQVHLRDISGRSGAGMIGDVTTFQISLENQNLMDGASCKLEVAQEWQSRIEIRDDSCEAFQVHLVNSPVLDESGKSAGDVLQVPYTVSLLSEAGDVLGTATGIYAFHNNYRSIELKLEPSGNRLKVNERRRAEVATPGAEIPDGVECEWNDSTNPIIKFIPDSANQCVGWLSTEVDDGAYAYKDLAAAGEKRGEVYLQLVTSSDFEMLGIVELKFKVSM